jgi:4-amino-4-deoxy-L-arabinose transferase-like glycosyltransferase
LHHEVDVARERNPSAGDAKSLESTAVPFTRSVFFIVLVALALRVAVIGIGHTYRITPRRDNFQFGWEMGRIARSLAEGQGFSSPTDLPTGPTAWSPPLYPYLLAAVFKLLGVYTRASAFAILAINSVFAGLTGLVVYRIGARLFGNGPARWAAWSWALFPYVIYWPVRVVWETSLSALLLSTIFLQTLRVGEAPRLRSSALLGLLWGMTALTNPTLLSFLPLSVAWIWFESRPRGAPIAAPLALTLAVCAALIAPWLLRNYRVFHQFVFIRDNFWMELHLANNPRSGGFWTRSEHPGNDPEQMRRFQEIGEMEYMHEQRAFALDFIRHHPEQFLRYSLQRGAYFWIGNPQATLVSNWSLGPARHMAFLISALAAFAGLWLAFRNRVPGTFLFACLLLVYPLPYYMAHPSPRYRHAIEPEMVLLIVYALWLARGRTVRLRRAARAAADGTDMRG